MPSMENTINNIEGVAKREENSTESTFWRRQYVRGHNGVDFILRVDGRKIFP